MQKERTYDGHYTKAMLRGRGWTPKAIEQLLGEPDEERKMFYTPGARIHIYYRDRVEENERTEAFSKARDKAAAAKSKRNTPAEPLPQTPANIARALYAINKSAKRRAAGAQSSYFAGAHAMARIQKEAKEEAYELKDQAIKAARKMGIATLDAIHRHRDTLMACWRIDDYTFHQLITAADGHDIIDLPDEWESPRVPLRGITIKVAAATLNELIQQAKRRRRKIAIPGLDETFPERRPREDAQQWRSWPRLNIGPTVIVEAYENEWDDDLDEWELVA